MEELVKAAATARDCAYVPYSKFKVGAAVLASSGRIYTGANVENASFGLTCCAERVAIFKAISEGETQLSTLAVVADTAKPASPCGACRQVMAEFGIKTIILCNTTGQRIKKRLDELLPYAFTGKDFAGVEEHE